jgi:uncharacterized protein (DUF58 family)
METASAGISKRRYATMLGAAIAHLALSQRDAVGLTLFAERVVAHLKPRAKTRQLDEILTALAGPTGKRAAASADALHEMAELMPRRGLVVLVSDLFFPVESVFSGLDHLLFRGHDLIIFHLLDPLEHDLQAPGQIRFQDLETGEELTTQTDEIRPLYQKALTEWQRELDVGLRGRSVDRVLLTTSRPLEDALVEYLTRRSQLF